MLLKKSQAFLFGNKLSLQSMENYQKLTGELKLAIDVVVQPPGPPGPLSNMMSSCPLSRNGCSQGPACLF